MSLPDDEIIVIFASTVLTFFSLTVFFVALVVTFQRRIRKKQEEFFRQILETQENERTRIGRDLHDDAGPILSAIKHEIQSVSFEGKNSLLESISQVISSIRTTTHNLSPPGLDKKGFTGALTYLCERLSESKNLEINLDIDLGDKQISKFAGVQLYRIASELINNAIKHGECSEIFVEVVNEDQQINLIVIDNGKGIDPERQDVVDGLGWQSIKQRLKLLKGTFRIDSKPGDATVITLTFPLDKVIDK